jgi:phosphoribosyl 1,2-cyclic phosphodiesterase
VVAFVTFSQRRWTGGIRFIIDKFQAHLDPGPGAIVRSVDARLDPRKVNVLLVSHSHPDHYGDAETFIEAMTEGTTRKKGTLVAPHSVLSGNDVCEASISWYHQGIVGRVVEVKPGDTLDVGVLRVNVTKALHSDPEAVGYCFGLPEDGTVGYTSDTEFFDGIEDYFKGVRMLILCVMRPSGSPWRGHMTSDDAARIISLVRPEVAVLTHFGLKMLMNGPERQAKSIEEKTGIPIKPAFDGMKVTMSDKQIVFNGKRI